MPTEIALHIAQYLNVRDLAALTRAVPRYLRISQTDRSMVRVMRHRRRETWQNPNDPDHPVRMSIIEEDVELSKSLPPAWGHPSLQGCAWALIATLCRKVPDEKLELEGAKRQRAIENFAARLALTRLGERGPIVELMSEVFGALARGFRQHTPDLRICETELARWRHHEATLTLDFQQPSASPLEDRKAFEQKCKALEQERKAFEPERNAFERRCNAVFDAQDLRRPELRVELCDVYLAIPSAEGVARMLTSAPARIGKENLMDLLVVVAQELTGPLDALIPRAGGTVKVQPKELAIIRLPFLQLLCEVPNTDCTWRDPVKRAIHMIENKLGVPKHMAKACRDARHHLKSNSSKDLRRI